MGVVYKAHDTKLDRIVALKFLPHHLTANEAEKARFLQEAKAAAALNHPNVCSVIDIQESEGRQFIIMEYIDGETLRRKLPVDRIQDALQYAIHIGDALQAAHVKGIVHRDVKCENIMLTSDGRIKVMDFGLAKLKGSLKLTRTSSTVGTLGYMAPEQIQGGEVDARSDIFSFGVVLFELLTGKLPFRGEHEAALMYSIVNEEPDSVLKFRPELPPELDRIIRRALEKDPEDRYQHADDFVSEIRRLQKTSTRVSRSSLASMPAQPIPAKLEEAAAPSGNVVRSGKKHTVRIIGISALVALMIGVVLWVVVFMPSSRTEMNPNMSFRTLQIPFQEIGYPSLSRDGGWVAFAGNADGSAWDIYLMNTSSGEPRQITTDSTGFMQSVGLSPDGSQIVYDRSDKSFTKPEIAIVSSLGGSSKRIVNIGFSPRWRPDGQRIAYVLVGAWGSTSGKTEFRSIKPNGSDDRLEFVDSLEATGLYSWSPDGNAICFTRRTGQGYTEIFVHDLNKATEHQVTSLKKHCGFVEWTENDEIVFSTDINGNENLWMIPSSGGTPVQITRGSGPDVAPVVSADLKRLLYVQQQNTGKIWTASLERAEAKQLTFDEANVQTPSFSPDGKRILYVVETSTPSGSSSALFAIDPEGHDKRQLLSDNVNIHAPKWSPDGKWIIFAAHPDSVPHDSATIYRIDPENPGSPVEIGAGFPWYWLNEHSFLFTRGTRTWMLDLNGGPPTAFFRDSTTALPVLNGEYILFSDILPTRRVGLWLEPATASQGTSPASKQLIKSLSDTEYDPVTRTVYYTSIQNQLRRVTVPGGVDELVPGTFPNLRLGTDMSISADGRKIVYLDAKRVSKLVMIENFH
jgi:eukaryotic-like serine/threonine-protein kinase